METNGATEKDMRVQQAVVDKLNQPESHVTAKQGEIQTPNFWGELVQADKSFAEMDKNEKRETLIRMASFMAEVDHQGVQNYRHIMTSNGTEIPVTRIDLTPQTIREMFAYSLEGRTPISTPREKSTKPASDIEIIQSGFSLPPSGHALTSFSELLPLLAERLPEYAARLQQAEATGEDVADVILYCVGTPTSYGTKTSDAFLDTFKTNGFQEAYGNTYKEVYEQLLDSSRDDQTAIKLRGNSMGAGIVRAAGARLNKALNNGHMKMIMDVPAGGHDNKGWTKHIKGIQTLLGYGYDSAVRLGREQKKRLSTLGAGDPLLFGLLQENHNIQPVGEKDTANKNSLLKLNISALYHGVGSVSTEPSDIPIEINYGTKDPATKGQEIKPQGNITVNHIPTDGHGFAYDNWKTFANNLKQAETLVRQLAPLPKAT